MGSADFTTKPRVPWLRIMLISSYVAALYLWLYFGTTLPSSIYVYFYRVLSRSGIIVII